MKNKLFALILLVAVVSFGATYNQGTGSRIGKPTVITTPWVAEFVVDISLDSIDSAYSRAYDVAQLPIQILTSSTTKENLNADSLNYDTTTSTATQVLDFGDVMFSCVDITNGTGTDSTIMAFQTQVSEYAYDGIDPFLPNSDTWTALHNDTISNTAAAMRETTRAFTPSSEAIRFVRWKIKNLSHDAVDATRCRIYWTRKQRQL